MTIKRKPIHVRATARVSGLICGLILAVISMVTLVMAQTNSNAPTHLSPLLKEAKELLKLKESVGKDEADVIT